MPKDKKPARWFVPPTCCLYLSKPNDILFPMHHLIKTRQERLHIPIMCHSLHMRVSTCNSYFMQNCFFCRSLKGTIVSQVAQELVGTSRHVDTVDTQCGECLLVRQHCSAQFSELSLWLMTSRDTVWTLCSQTVPLSHCFSAIWFTRILPRSYRRHTPYFSPCL